MVISDTGDVRKDNLLSPRPTCTPDFLPRTGGGWGENPSSLSAPLGRGKKAFRKLPALPVSVIRFHHPALPRPLHHQSSRGMSDGPVTPSRPASTPTVPSHPSRPVTFRPSHHRPSRPSRPTTVTARPVTSVTFASQSHRYIPSHSVVTFLSALAWPAPPVAFRQTASASTASSRRAPGRASLSCSRHPQTDSRA